MGSLMMRTLALIGLLVATLALGPVAFSVQVIDGASQRERAERILDEPRFGETRPTLWDRFSSWWDDTFQPSSNQDTSPGNGGTADGSGSGGAGANGNPGSPTDEGGAPSAGANGLDGEPSSPSAAENPASGLAALGTALQMGLAVGVLVMIGLAVRWLVGRRTVRAKPAEAGAQEESLARDPAELFAEADAAAARGDFATAIRVRFKAGVARLGRAGLISAGEVTTNGGISEELGIEEFDRLAGTFERIVYGGQPATAEQEGESRATWSTVLRGARR